MATKIAEHLVILHDVGEGLISRAYNVLHFTIPDVSDAELYKYFKRLGENFPKYNDKLAKEKGHDAFTRRVTEISTMFAGYYHTFVDILDFNEKALTVLNDVSRSFKELEQDFNPDMVRFFFNVLVMYVKLQVLLSRSFDQARNILASYARAHHLSSGNTQVHLMKVAQYIQDYAKPLERIRLDFESMSAFIGNHIRKMQSQLTLFTDRSACIAKGIFSTLDKTSDATSHRHEFTHYQALFVSSMRQWVLWSLLVCPQEFAIPGTVELACVPLSETFLIPIHRNETLNVQEEFEKLFSDFQIKAQKFKLSKYRQSHRDIMGSYDRCLEQRHDFRRYLCAELHAARALIKTSKAVAAPKLLFYLSLMRLGRDEVYWYFMHAGCRPYRCASKFSIPRDPHIVSIIADILFICQVMTSPDYIDAIRNYYAEHLVMDAVHFKTLRENLLASHATSLPGAVNRIADEIQTTFENPTEPKSLDAFRLNLFRFSSALSSSAINVPAPACVPLMRIVNMAVLQSRAIDSLPKLIEQHAGFKFLYWRRDVLQNEFEATLLPAAPGSVNAVALLRILPQFNANVHRVAPEEQSTIGIDTVRLADQWLLQISNACITWLHSHISYQSTLQSRLTPVHAIQRMVANDTPLLPNQEPPALPYFPGTESNPRLTNELIGQRNELNALTSIGAIMGQWDRFIVYQHELSPREYFITATQHAMRSTIRSICLTANQQSIRRPSEILSAIHTLLHGYMHLDHVAKLDMATIARTVLLTEIAGVYPKAGGEPFQPASITSTKAEVTNTAELSDPISVQLCGWYIQLFASDLDSLRISHSQVRQCFEARPFTNEKGVVEVGRLPAELYTDRVELRALATLLGPRGVETLTKSLLSIVQRHVERMFEILSNNAPTLSSIRGRFTEPQAWAIAADAISDKDQFISASIAVGCCLKFREMMQQALLEVSNDAIPTAVRAISEALQTARTLVADPLFDSRLSGLSVLAEQCGLPRTIDDRELRDCLRRFKTSTQDAQLWALLPEMYCLCFTSSPWTRAHYDIDAEGHKNNAHLLAYTIRDLISVFVMLPSELKHVPQDAVESLKSEVERFLQVASFSLLNINSSLGKTVPPHIVVFLQQFLEAAGTLLPMSRLEKCFPYTLIRTNYIQMYEVQSKSYNVLVERE